ncbi:TetR/AcrR family transcriptional regulator [Catellatospora sichuanensis]|uniref:TetR/AcrR family transcriptional regulator n=1 Tax=Catellatospora sichuanensis TaxID=1969805 RepID=UPI001FEB9A40|nr:TetR/AcrR family transcriptional regulator [Catellatospora sichuanensis]
MVSRYTVITDAAIALVAEQGMRGLTHRAVDARAGLPTGTTSAYYRTRKALIEALVQRLADLDRADLEARDLPADQAPAYPHDRRFTPADLDGLAAGIAAVIDAWLTTGRDRSLARYACLLEATHHPELRDILGHGAASRAQARALLAAAGARDPDRAGDHFVACVDGLLFDRLAGAGALTAPPPGTAESRTDLTRAVRALLRAMSG